MCMKAVLILPPDSRKLVWNDATARAVREITRLQCIIEPLEGTKWDKEGALIHTIFYAMKRL